MFDDKISLECPPNQVYCPPFGTCEDCLAVNEPKEEKPKYIMGEEIKCNKCNDTATHVESGVFYCIEHWIEHQRKDCSNVIQVDFGQKQMSMCCKCGERETEITLPNGGRYCFHCYDTVIKPTI